MQFKMISRLIFAPSPPPIHTHRRRWCRPQRPLCPVGFSPRPLFFPVSFLSFFWSVLSRCCSASTMYLYYTCNQLCCVRRYVVLYNSYHRISMIDTIEDDAHDSTTLKYHTVIGCRVCSPLLWTVIGGRYRRRMSCWSCANLQTYSTTSPHSSCTDDPVIL